MVTRPVAVRLTDDELAELKALARARRVTRSAMHRALLTRAIQEERRDVSTDVEAHAVFADALGEGTVGG
jgi:hypothetical protein